MGELGTPDFNLIDIRRDKSEMSLLESINATLITKNNSPMSLTTLLLYDEKGLKLFEEITYLEEYYLTNAEIEAFGKHADAIASRIPSGSRLVELGSGNLRKVNILLEALERACKPAEYFALDLSYSELQRTFAELDVSRYRYVKFNALHGTYDDGLAWLARPENQDKPTCVLTLGSSLGNFSRTDAANFLKGFKNALKPTDLMLVGLDACQDPDRVFTAYNDSQGVTELFYRNGLEHANQVFGHEIFKQSDWSVEGSYDTVDHKHLAHSICLNDASFGDIQFRKGDKVLLEHAYKYSQEQSDALWHTAGLIPQGSYGNARDDYHLYILSPSLIQFSEEPAVYAAAPTPTLGNWRQLWNAWDTVTKSMVPQKELMSKPIQLRNNLIFYLGHIPTFADIHFTKATGLKATEPSYYTTIFERGIDPDVDDPEKCHNHSVIPSEWPPLEEILDFETRVRARIIEHNVNGNATKNKKLARALWLAFEHEAMHLETFLYMLLQSQNVLPPPGREIPNFTLLAQDAELGRQPNKWHPVPVVELQIGIDDPETDSGPERYFAWDNERPARQVKVPAFEAQSRCISIGEYAKYLEDTKQQTVPASWTAVPTAGIVKRDNINDEATRQPDASNVLSSNMASAAFLEGKAIRTVYGPIPLYLALDWPVMASYDELAAYANWADGRIPTFEEARSIYHYVENKKIAAMKTPSSLISAVNGHLCNNGVEETPPSTSLSNSNGDGISSSLTPESTFINLNGCNVAFKNWFTTPITGDADRLRGQSDAGGLWEWTSSPLAAYEGFKSMDLYPGYTADFFDDKHNICLGGSWATVPRIAGRKSFVNWYQRNYPYTWATARLVRDLT